MNKRVWILTAAVLAAATCVFAQEAVDVDGDVAATAPATAATATAPSTTASSTTATTAPANTSSGTSIFGNRNQGRSGNSNNTRNTGRSGSSGRSLGGASAAGDVPAGVTILPAEDKIMAQYSMFSRERVIRYAPETPPVTTRQAPVYVAPPPPPLPVLRGTGIPEHGDDSSKAAAMIEYADGTHQMVHIGDLIEGNKGGKISAIDELGVDIVGDDGKSRRVALGQDLAGSESASSAAASPSSTTSSTMTSALPPAASAKEEEMRRRRQQENNR